MSGQKLRITIIGLHYAPEVSGNAPYTASLAEGLAAAGHDVQVITGYPHYPEWRVHDDYTGWSRIETIRGVKVKRLRHYVPRQPTAIRRVHMELSFGFRAICTSWKRPDFVLLVSPALFSSALATLRLRLNLKPPTSAIWVQDIYSRGLSETGNGGSLISRLSKMAAAFEAKVFSTVNGVVAIHDRFRLHMTGALGIPFHRISVIRNWTHLPISPLDDAAETRKLLGWQPGDVIALHAGNMGMKQGLENLVETARLAQKRNSPIRIVLMGDGNQRRKLQTLAQGLHNIEFLPPLPEDEFMRTLAAADVLLVNELPGLRDMAVPSKLTSYFNAGVAVVAATDENSVTAGEIAASRAGLRVDPADPQALLDAVLSLSKDPAQCRVLGRNGLSYREETLAGSYAIGRYDEYITNLVKSCRR